MDLQVLDHIQTQLRSFSAQRIENQKQDYNGSPLPLPKLKIDHDMFSSVFLIRLPELNDFVKLNGPLPSRILPHMYLGSLVHTQNLDLLHRLVITHIVSVGENLSWVSVSTSNSKSGNILKDESSSLPPQSLAVLRSNSNISDEPDDVYKNYEGNNVADIIPHIANNNNQHVSYTIYPRFFQVIEQDGFKICKINNLQDNGKDPLTGRVQLNLALDFIDECQQSGGKV